jgi:putative metallohydrolase (TIGR04338 family)
MTSTSELYAAEQTLRRLLDRQGEFPTIEAAGSVLTLPVEARFGDLPSVQRYVDTVLALPWVRAQYRSAQGKVTVRERRGNKFAHYEHNAIAIPPYRIGGRWAMRELVVLHEIAHHLVPNSADHGSAFRNAFTDLVEHCIGLEAGLLLRIFIHESSAA